MFTIGEAFLWSDAAGRGSMEQSVMTTEGFACWLPHMNLLCCREAEPDIFPAYSEHVSSASQDWSHGDLNNDTVVSCSARSNCQTGQYFLLDHEPHLKQNSRSLAISNGITQHVQQQVQILRSTS